MYWDESLEERQDLFPYFKNIPIGSGRGVSLKEFAILIKLLSNSDINLKFGELPYRNNEIMHSVSDLSALKKIGWTNDRTLEEGLNETIKEMS